MRLGNHICDKTCQGLPGLTCIHRLVLFTWTGSECLTASARGCMARVAIVDIRMYSSVCAACPEFSAGVLAGEMSEAEKQWAWVPLGMLFSEYQLRRVAPVAPRPTTSVRAAWQSANQRFQHRPLLLSQLHPRHLLLGGSLPSIYEMACRQVGPVRPC